MSDRIEVTDAEWRAAAEAVSGARAKGKRHHGLVKAVIAAINAKRPPAPAKPQESSPDPVWVDGHEPEGWAEIASVTTEIERGGRITYRVYNLWDANGVLIHSERVSSPYDLDSGEAAVKAQRLGDVLARYLSEG